MLPYPDFREKDGKTTIAGEVFLKGITELRITDYKDGEFTVRLRCHLKEADEEEYKHEYLCKFPLFVSLQGSTKGVQK